jgi:hypothetical protein
VAAEVSSGVVATLGAEVRADERLRPIPGVPYGSGVTSGTCVGPGRGSPR